jgi:hypothetical protein
MARRPPAKRQRKARPLAKSGVTPTERALIRAFEDLQEADLSWAVVGGFAVSARAAPRFTRDADFAVAVKSDAEAEAAVYRMQALGYAVLATVEHRRTKRLAMVRLRSPHRPKVVVDLLFAATGIEEEIVARATPAEPVRGAKVPVARIGHLLAMKILAMDDQRRPQDRADINALVPIADMEERRLARAALARAQELGLGRTKRLVALFDRLVSKIDAFPE